jgi:hypothetical protein
MKIINKKNSTYSVLICFYLAGGGSAVNTLIFPARFGRRGRAKNWKG